MRKIFAGALSVMLLSCACISAKDEDAEVRSIIARHLRAIGSEEALAQTKTRVAEGSTIYRLIVGGTGTLSGKTTLASEGSKIRLVMRFANQDYPGENIVTDGKKFQTLILPRSELAELIYNQEGLLRNGLFGGVLTLAWPFFSSDWHRAKVTCAGLKEIDGLKLYEIRYVPQKRTDLTIRLYFDPETGRHICSVYTMEFLPRLSGSEVTNVHQQPVTYRLEERFGEFREFDGLVLPTNWELRLSMEGYRSQAESWDTTFSRIMNNLTLDPRNFLIK